MKDARITAVRLITTHPTEALARVNPLVRKIKIRSFLKFAGIALAFNLIPQARETTRFAASASPSTTSAQAFSMVFALLSVVHGVLVALSRLGAGQFG